MWIKLMCLKYNMYLNLKLSFIFFKYLTNNKIKINILIDLLINKNQSIDEDLKKEKTH